MINISNRLKPSVSMEDIDRIIQDEIKHPYYTIALDRAKIFNTWYEAETDDYIPYRADLFRDKQYIIDQSNIESTKDYEEKLKRMRLFPLEAKFLSSQKRIYDENNVDRQYADDTAEFWQWKETHFDDQGSSITEFYRDKVLFVKETLGFGAIVTDLLTDNEGGTITDNMNNVIPYNFVLRPHEILNFEMNQGHLTFLVSKQRYKNALGDEITKYTAYTPNTIRVYEQRNSSTQKTLTKEIDNPFGHVPATLISGEVDATSSFNIGKPRRYSIKGLYLAVSELFYDLQKGSELFGHPIPALSESLAKAMAGVSDDDDYDSSTIKEEVGMAVIFPDGVDPPSKMFYQADMQGLQHLRDVIFKDLMSLIFNLAMVRDKSVVKSNVSGDAKFLDNVEEQGLLAQTAMDMEDIEAEVLRRMAMVRDEDPAKFKVTYSKHYDLSSAQEIYDDIIEGFQYGSMTLEMFKYLVREYLRKRSAPQAIIDASMDEIENIGFPVSPSDLSSISGVIENADFTGHAKKYGVLGDSERAVTATEGGNNDQEEDENFSIENDNDDTVS